MWSNQQKQIIHQYARWARLPDPEYRALLKSATGFTSAKSAGLTQYHFDLVMAKIEAVLAYRIAEGLCPQPPAPRNNHAYNPDHWRRRLPPSGVQNSRLAHKWQEVWTKLQDYLSPDQCTTEYLCGIASHACGHRISDIWSLKSHEASLLIEALKARLAHAITTEPTAASLVPAGTEERECSEPALYTDSVPF